MPVFHKDRYARPISQNPPIGPYHSYTTVVNFLFYGRWKAKSKSGKIYINEINVNECLQMLFTETGGIIKI